MYVCGGVRAMFCMDCVCRHGNTSLACLVMWLMAASPVSGCTVETRQSQDPLRGTCNPTMGLHYAYTSYSAQKGAYIHTNYLITIMQLRITIITVMALMYLWTRLETTSKNLTLSGQYEEYLDKFVFIRKYCLDKYKKCMQD